MHVCTRWLFFEGWSNSIGWKKLLLTLNKAQTIISANIWLKSNTCSFLLFPNNSLFGGDFILLFFSVSLSWESVLRHTSCFWKNTQDKKCAEQGHLGSILSGRWWTAHRSSRSCWLPAGSPDPRMPWRKGHPKWAMFLKAEPECIEKSTGEELEVTPSSKVQKCQGWAAWI